MYFIIIFGIFCCSCIHGMQKKSKWIKLLNEHYTISLKTPVIYGQYCAHIMNNIPAYENSRITSIPLKEYDEKIIDFRTKKHKRIYMMPDPSPGMVSPFHNSGTPHNSIMRASVEVGLYNMIDRLDDLAENFKYKKEQFHIGIFRAWCNQHNCGGSVDIRIWDAYNQTYLDMGDFRGQNENISHTFSENITSQQRHNRLYCLIAAARAGLTNHPKEYWHFSIRDKVASYWNDIDPQKRASNYSPISFDSDYTFDPDSFNTILILMDMLNKK